MPEFQCGRATLKAKSGKKSKVCDICGKCVATMYEIGLAESPGRKPELQITLCVTCNSHLSGCYQQYRDYHDDIPL